MQAPAQCSDRAEQECLHSAVTEQSRVPVTEPRVLSWSTELSSEHLQVPSWARAPRPVGRLQHSRLIASAVVAPEGALFGAGYELYKGKSAIQFKPLSPIIGRKGGSLVLERKGVLLLEAANSDGVRSCASHALPVL